MCLYIAVTRLVAISNHLGLSVMQRKKMFISIHMSIVALTLSTQHFQMLASAETQGDS